ncbi:MAG: sel1 repeat family protein, partial [Desulfobacteraceae bacterium]|nr:sel1 repeat family protein [Desulfobacteraceae bacterium]
QAMARTDSAAELKDAQMALEQGEFEKAFAEYHRFAVEKNNPLAQFTLGLFFQNGWGRPVDPSAACGWFEKAAEGGIPAASHFWASCLVKGIGRPADPDKAAGWYEKAAALGHYMSLCSLAELYMTGTGVPKDPAKGLVLCRQAAEKSVVPAQTRTGLFLLKDDTSIRNLDEAFMWLSTAAQANAPEAQYYLAVMLRDGLGRPKAPEDARYWFESAASKGYGPAYFPAGELYFNSPVNPNTGILPAQDLAKAYLWVSAASRRTKDPEDLKRTNDLLAKILKIMPESWLPDLDAKVDAHLSAHPVRP